MLRQHGNATTRLTTTEGRTPCPWCGTACTSDVRAEHDRLDRQSESTYRRRWAA